MCDFFCEPNSFEQLYDIALTPFYSYFSIFFSNETVADMSLSYVIIRRLGCVFVRHNVDVHRL